MVVFTLLGHKEGSLGFQGRYMKVQQNTLPENPLPTGNGSSNSMKNEKPYST